MIGGINMVVAFTGYRPEKMPFVESKKDEAFVCTEEMSLVQVQQPHKKYP